MQCTRNRESRRSSGGCTRSTGPCRRSRAEPSRGIVRRRACPRYSARSFLEAPRGRRNLQWDVKTAPGASRRAGQRMSPPARRRSIGRFLPVEAEGTATDGMRRDRSAAQRDGPRWPCKTLRDSEAQHSTIRETTTVVGFVASVSTPYLVNLLDMDTLPEANGLVAQVGRAHVLRDVARKSSERVLVVLAQEHHWGPLVPAEGVAAARMPFATARPPSSRTERLYRASSSTSLAPPVDGVPGPTYLRGPSWGR